MAGTVRRLLCTSLGIGSLLLAAPAAAICTGDCDRSGAVTVEEVIRAVGIALGKSAVALCQSVDRDGSGAVEIDEILTAVKGVIDGCPAEATVTPTEMDTATPTPTATENRPPTLPTVSVYRSYPGLPIRVALDAYDPDGSAVQCTVGGLPAGAAFDDQTGVLDWTPNDDQLGPFYLPYACADDAVPPALAHGELTFKLSPLDACTTPSCDPASGCTAELAPLGLACCAGLPTDRVAEPVAGCPAGRVMYIGQSATAGSFGRLQNCDQLVMRSMMQANAELRFHVEARCLNTASPIRMHVRMDSTGKHHPVPVDYEVPPFRLAEQDGGFARYRNLRFSIRGLGPFFDLQDADGNLTVTLTDVDGVSVTENLRLRLTFTPRASELPDVDPTLPPTPTRTVSPTPA